MDLIRTSAHTHVLASLENVRQDLPQEQSPDKARERLVHIHQQVRAYQDIYMKIHAFYL